MLLLAGAPGRAETVEDSANRHVTVPAMIARVVPAGAPAQVLLQALAPGKLAGLVDAFAPEHVIYVDAALAALPQIPVLTRTDAPGDVAAVAALRPDLALDYGTVSARFVAADEKIGAELNIPALIFDGAMGSIPPIARTLGRVLGVPTRGDDLARAALDVLATVAPATEVGDAERVRVYMARGDDALDAARAGTSYDEPIRRAGGSNVVKGGGATFRRMSVAEVVALKPAVVVVSSAAALTSPLHAALPKGTRYVLDAGEPFKVLTGPPSVNRLIGTLALAALLHPDKVAIRPELPGQLESKLFSFPAGSALPAPLALRD